MPKTMLLIVLILFSLTGTAFAQTIICDGKTCGGTGVVSWDSQLRDYVYRVTGGVVPQNPDSVFIGTHDPDLTHYNSVCLPSGWTYEIIPMSRQDYSNPINHGAVAPAPDGNCPYTFLFRNVSGAPLSTIIPTDFGFNYYGYPHTVDWMVAAFPPISANWTAVVGTGTGPVHGPMCDTLCDHGVPIPNYFLAGRKDNFTTTDGSEPSSPSPALLAYMQTLSGGANPYFDSPTFDRAFGHTFTGWNASGCVVGAQLCFRLTAISGANNDNIGIREDVVNPIWSVRLIDLKAALSGNPADTFFTVGDTLNVCLDLANLPLIKRGTTYYWPTNILATLQDGDMDILLQDDTKIDFAELTVTICGDTCYATGDVDGNGTPLTLSDLSALIAFVYTGALPNGPLWQCDLNGDDYVDQLDIDRFQCYLTQGISCFPIYPVPTDCDPDTVRGACCENDSCTVKSAYNCALVAGTYQGDGTSCNENACKPPSGACCWPDGSCTQVMNPTAECSDLGGTFMGFYSPCTPNPCQAKCIKPPIDPLAWWPLDELGPTIAYDIAGTHNGVHLNTIPHVPGKVLNSYRFDWDNIGRARVWDDPFDEIGTGDFSIDAWIYPEDLASQWIYQYQPAALQTRIILDNHLGPGGLTFFVENNSSTNTGKLALTMGSTKFIYPVANVVNNVWQHVAVTVSRTSGTPTITFYYNGQALPTTFTPVSGVMYGGPYQGWPRMDIGHATPLSWSGCVFTNRFFTGRIDELQIYKRVLSPGEVYSIWKADQLGKCKVYCYVPREVVFCPSDNSRKFKLTIRNESDKDFNCTWGIGSPGICPAGFSGSNYGASFGLVANQPTSLTVKRGTFKEIEITATKPTSPLFGPGKYACFSAWVQDNDTQDRIFCAGYFRGVSNFYCPYVTSIATHIPGTVYPLIVDSSEIIEFPICNTGDPSGHLAYTVRVRSSCSCPDDQDYDPFADDSIISVNGLPPGTPYEGAIDIPLGDSATIQVSARLTRYMPFRWEEIVLHWNVDALPGGELSVAVIPTIFDDCNHNGIPDSTDIAEGASLDTNSDSIPDECEFYGGEPPCPVCGDANGDGGVNIGDAVFLINHVFKNGLEPNPKCAGDANGDSNVNVGDAVYLINHVFKGGPAPNLNCCL